MRRYQLENPNNARVKIDYSNLDSPVKFDYVASDSEFKIIKSLFYKIFLIHPFGILIGLAIPLLIANIFSLLTSSNTIFALVFFSSYAFLSFLLPVIMAFLLRKNKKFLLLMPKLQWVFGGQFFVIEVKPKDIKNNKFEIPLFRNVGLDYIVTEDFSEYLKSVEIIEHNFNFLIKSYFFNKVIKKPNQYLWRAVFTFSKKPKTGVLKCRFN
jgi:hypothetical protein